MDAGGKKLDRQFSAVNSRRQESGWMPGFLFDPYFHFIKSNGVDMPMTFCP
jgi:hypothetical protein